MKKILSLLHCLVLIGFFIVGLNGTVSADSPYVYYFSDSLQCYNTRNSLVSNTPLTYSDIHLEDWSGANYAFYSYFDNNIADYDELEDVIIIFEMANGFKHETDNNTGDLMPEKLETVFANWKDNGCYIMFICGTDEVRYLNHNDFLDYVDFHIILDVRTNFIMSAFYYLEQDCSPNLENYDLLFDNFFVNTYGPTGRDYLKHEFLIPYIRSRYYNDIVNLNCTNAGACQNHNVSIYMPNTALTSYMNIVDGFSYDISNLQPNYDLYIVAGSTIEPQFGISDNQTILGYFDALYPKKLFYYNINNVPLSTYFSNLYTTVYPCDPYSYTPQVLEMIESFIFEDYEDWYNYNNWEGRCDITHIMMPTGNDGWMLNFYDGETGFVNCWGLFLDAASEDYLLYDDGSLF